MTTHQGLFDEAEAALTRAAAYTSRADAMTVASCDNAARQCDRLIRALARHLDYLHGQALAGMAQTEDPTDRGAATTALIGALRGNTDTQPDGQTTERQGSTTRAIAKAADAVRLATDVLATHHRPGHGGRTPDARPVEDQDARWAVTVRVADIAYTAALTRSRLAALPSGHRTREASDVANGAGLINAARGVLTTAADTGPGGNSILELGPFAAPLARTNPLAPAATALQYARAETHQLSLDRRLGVTTLRDMALLGLSIAQHTDAISRAAAAQTNAHLPDNQAQAVADILTPAADEARRLARRWRDLYGQLGSLRSPDAAQAGLAHAALTVRAALEAHTRHNSRWATPEEMHPTRQHMEELLTGIRAIALPLDEIATAGQHAVATLHRRGRLYIDARALPCNPELLHAQRTGRYVPAPTEHSQQLAGAWKELGEDSRSLTTTLAASSGLVGQHPRSAAAHARASRTQSTEPSRAEARNGPHSQQGEVAPGRPREGALVEAPASVAGEPISIESARQVLRALAAAADRASAAIAALSTSLTDAGIDTATLDAVTGILEAAERLRATANRALSGLNHRHAPLEDAANASPEPGAIHFYRP